MITYFEIYYTTEGFACAFDHHENHDCGWDHEGEDTLSFDITSATLQPGASITITSNVECTWTSSDPSIAIVEGSGTSVTVTAIAEGTVTIKGVTPKGQVGTCTVTIEQEAMRGLDYDKLDEMILD